MQSRQTTDAASLRYTTAILFAFWTKLLSWRKKPGARKAKDPADKVEWTPEALPEEFNEVIGNVGKTVEFEKYRTTDETAKSTLKW